MDSENRLHGERERERCPCVVFARTELTSQSCALCSAPHCSALGVLLCAYICTSVCMCVCARGYGRELWVVRRRGSLKAMQSRAFRHTWSSAHTHRRDTQTTQNTDTITYAHIYDTCELTQPAHTHTHLHLRICCAVLLRGGGVFA